MAAIKRYIYDFDPTGRESANLIKNERHTITPENRTPQNVLIPGYAPYFRQSLIVKDMITGLPLQEGIDYTCEWPIVHTADNLEGYSPVYGGIQFIDNDITGQFELQYQTIGGQYALDGVAIAQALANQANDPLTTTFEEILGRPIKLPPLEHVHSIDDFVGFEDLVNGVDRLRLAIELLAREDKDSHPGYETLVDVYFKLQQTANDLIVKTDNTDARLTSEIQRVTDNTANLINALREEKNNDDRNLRQDLTNKINTAKAELTSSINTLGTSLENKLNAFKTETGNNFTNVRNSIRNNYDDLKGRIDTLVRRADAGDQKDTQQDARLTAIEQKNVQQDGRLTAIEAKDNAQDGRLTAIEQKNTQQDGRLTAIENNYVNVRNIAYGDLAKKYGDARNSFISGSLNQQQATDLDAPKLGNTDYNGLVISNGVQTTQLLVGGPAGVYLRIHDDNTNPNAPWATTEVLTKASADSVLNELGNVVFTTRDQVVDGNKTFKKGLKFGSTTVADRGTLTADANNMIIRNATNPAQSTLLMGNNGVMEWTGSQIVANQVGSTKPSLKLEATSGAHTLLEYDPASTATYITAKNASGGNVYSYMFANNGNTGVSTVLTSGGTSWKGFGSWESQKTSSSPFLTLFANDTTSNKFTMTSGSYHPLIKGRAFVQGSTTLDKTVSLGWLESPGDTTANGGSFVFHHITSADTQTESPTHWTWRFESHAMSSSYGKFNISRNGTMVSIGNTATAGSHRVIEINDNGNLSLLNIPRIVLNRSNAKPVTLEQTSTAFNILHPSARKNLALNNDGTIKWGNKDILWKEGNYFRIPMPNDTAYAGWELERVVGTEKQYWRWEVSPNNTTNAVERGAFKLYRSATTGGDANAKTALHIHFQNKSGTVALVSDVNAAKTALEQKNTQQDSRLTALETKNGQQDTRLTNLENKNGQQDNRLTALENKNTQIDSVISNIGSRLTGTYVTVDTTQTVTGQKTFSQHIFVGSSTGAGLYSRKLVFANSADYTMEASSIAGRNVLNFKRISIEDFYMYSDRRLKENVKPIENALDTVSKLNGYTYNLKGESKGNAGVIAQELQEVLPDLVSENSETSMLSVNHISLIGYLIESIKELKKDNDDLRKRIVRLEGK